MKEYTKTTGFILGNSAVKENSAVITALTPDIGIINFVKHGYNSKKNSLKSVLQPINLVELHLEIQNDNYKIIEASAKEIFDGIKKDYKKTVCALSVFSTLTNSEIYDKKDYDLIFTLVKKFIEALNTKEPCLLTTSIYFYFQLAWCLGISFSFNTDKNSDYCYLEIENGLFFQNKSILQDPNLFPVSKKLYESLKKFTNMRFADIDKLNYITINEYKEFIQMYKRYTGYHFNKSIIIKPAMIVED